MNVTEIFGDDYSSFSQVDPFNNNLVEGYLCKIGDTRYGALLIEKVNGEPVPQLIYCTPKIIYPFDKSGNWHLPPATKIERYEKLDGTNIFQYMYEDKNGVKYVSYKTRLLPFVQESRFGPFLSMLRELMGTQEYKYLDEGPLVTGYNMSYELWGARNPHTVKYTEPLRLSLLFARNGQSILPPSMLEGEIVKAEFRGTVTDGYVDCYKESQKYMETTLVKDDEGYYSGMEGEVWYLQTADGKWIQYKCKPETIECIHWAAGGIGSNQIAATCENALENWDNPTIENVISLLQEEYKQEAIEKAHYKISRILNKVIENHLFTEQVLKEYREVGVSILEDKRTVMRALSGKFNRELMGKVYTAIWVHTVR